MSTTNPYPNAGYGNDSAAVRWDANGNPTLLLAHDLSGATAIDAHGNVAAYTGYYECGGAAWSCLNPWFAATYYEIALNGSKQTVTVPGPARALSANGRM